MKIEQVTYDKFLQIVECMRESGEKLTVRNVHAQTGGSFSKISEFLKRFEQERGYLSLAKQSDISDALRQALLAEIGRSVLEATTGFEKQIAEFSTHLDEANAQLSEQEKAIALLNDEAVALKEKLMLAQQSMSDLESANQTCLHKLDAAQKEMVLAVTDAAKSKLQLERADKDLLELKENNKTLQEQLKELTKEKFEAEKRAAVIEAKFEQLLKTEQNKNVN